MSNVRPHVAEKSASYEVLKKLERSAPWPRVPLTEAVDLNPKPDRSSLSDQLEVSFVPMAAVEAGTGAIDASTVRRYGEVKKGYTYFRDGDVLFAKITPCMENGKIAVARKLRNGIGFGSTEFHVLRPREGVDAHYVYHFVSSARFRAEAAHNMTGAVGQKRVPAAFLEQSEIPLPPIDEQRRIVAELEKQFSRLDEAVATLKRVKATLKRYKTTVLKAAVEGRLVPTDGPWIHAQLGTVTQSIRNGYSKKPDAERGTRILRISAVRPMEIDLNDVRYLSGAPADYEPFLVEAGDVLFTRYNGNREYVGACACIPANVVPTVYPDKLIRVRVSSTTMLPQFLAIMASTGRTRDYIKSKTRTTAGQSGISGGDLKSLPLDIPSVSEQTRIVAEVNRLFSLASGIEAEIMASIKRAERLRHAILANAFHEELGARLV